MYVTIPCSRPTPSSSPPLRHVHFVAIVGILLSSCAKAPPSTAPILLFAGAGTSPNDVQALERLMQERSIEYDKLTSAQANGMSAGEFGRHRLLIVPGGDFLEIGKGLTPVAFANIREAVHGGMSYLGICAGAFLAGDATYPSLKFAPGVQFPFYADEGRGIRKAAVRISTVDMPILDQYWEDGPQLSGWGDVVGKYPDGTPAVVEGNAGAGFVILTGIHAEAPSSWRGSMTFSTPAAVDNTYAARLIEAAARRTPLPHFQGRTVGAGTGGRGTFIRASTGLGYARWDPAHSGN